MNKGNFLSKVSWTKRTCYC